MLHFYSLSSKAKLAFFSTFILSHIQQCSAPNAHCIEQVKERALSFVYSNHPSYESFLNKAHFPSLGVEKRCRENIPEILLMKRVRHGTNSFCFLIYFSCADFFYVTSYHIIYFLIHIRFFLYNI